MSDILVDLRLKTQKQTGIRDFVETCSNTTELFYKVQSELESKQVNATHVSHPFWQILVLKILHFQKKTGRSMEVRLNSPCDKFKITNIGDDQVDLAPEDIPGTSFIEE